MGIGLPEILIVLAIVVIFFGAKKLPELGKGLGSGMREFKDGIQGGGDDAKAAITPPPPAAAAPPITPGADAQPVAPAEPTAPPRTED